MATAWWVTADVRDGLAAIPDASIDLVLTSPPFLALRSYLPADHPDKALEIGSEATPGEFLTTLLALTDEFARVLAPHGSICVELGDTYSGSGGAGGDYGDGGLRKGQQAFDGSARRSRKGEVSPDGQTGHYNGRQLRPFGPNGGTGWPLAKSLTLVPTLYSASLAYGRNLLTGQPCRQWRIRNVVAWVRPNPPVGALGDKFRPATSYMTVACLSGQRYFNLDATREPHKSDPGSWENKSTSRNMGSAVAGGDTADPNHSSPGNPAGAPPLDWWCIPPGGYSGAHYAVFPPELLTRPIKAMCPSRVCVTCGKPSERIHVENPAYQGRAGGPTHNNAERGSSLKGYPHAAYAPSKWSDAGFTDCGHNTWRNGRVLDPFGGSGTTAMVATGHGRDCLSVDIDARNADLAYQRVGMWLREVTLTELGHLLGGTREAA